MTEYINKQALLAEYDCVHVGPPGGARKLIEEAPPAEVVPVVRCKDCIVSYCVDYEDIVCGRTCVNVDADDFCSYGERKDGDGNG